MDCGDICCLFKSEVTNTWTDLVVPRDEEVSKNLLQN